MGREMVHFEVIGSVSRHNSEEDNQDNVLWVALCERLQAIMEEPQYEPLGLIQFP